MKENPNKALHRTAHKAPPVTADVQRPEISEITVK
jgi:hypothetical protein